MRLRSSRRTPLSPHDAPLIGERAATRGRIATECADERAGVKWYRSLTNRIERREPRSGCGNRRTEGRMPRPITENPEAAFRRPFCAPLIVAGGVKRASSARAPAARTGSNCGNLDACAATRPPKRGRQNPESGTRLFAARTLCTTFVADNDAALIGERAAARGRTQWKVAVSANYIPRRLNSIFV
jgi:hypothetical protein